MKPMVQFLLAAFCACLPSAHLWGATYYVSTTGNDSNNGLSVATAWADLYNLQNHTPAPAPGDVILMENGSYPQSVTFNLPPSGVQGAVGNPIVIEQDPGNPGATITGEFNFNQVSYFLVQNLTFGGGSPEVEIQSGASNITLNNDTFQNAAGNAVEIYNNTSPASSYISIINSFFQNLPSSSPAIMINNSNNHIYIGNNTIQNLTGSGTMAMEIYTSTSGATMSNISITGNTISNITNNPNQIIAIGGAITNAVISNNVIHDVAAQAIDVVGYYGFVGGGSPSNFLVQGNTIYNDISTNNKSGAAIYLDGANNSQVISNCINNADYGIEVGSSAFVSSATENNNLVANNIISNCLRSGLDIGSWTTGDGSANNNKIYNNTLYNDDTQSDGYEGHIGMIELQIGSNNDFENNIIYAKASTVLLSNPFVETGTTFNHNLYYSTNTTTNWQYNGNANTYTSFAAWQAGSGQDAAGAWADPLFVNASPATCADFNLQCSSPAINAGVNESAAGVTNDYLGNPRPASGPFDSGAYQVICGTPSFTPTPSPSATPTATKTITLSATPSSSPSNTASPSATRSSTPSNTPSATLSSTPSLVNTSTDTSSATPSFTATPTATPTSTSTPLNTATDTRTASPSATQTVTYTQTSTLTGTPSASPSATQTVTYTQSSTYTNTPTASPSATVTDSNTATPSATPSFTSTGTDTVSPVYTFTATPTATSSSTVSDTPSQTVTPSNTPTDTPTVSVTNTPSATPSYSNTPTQTPTVTPSVTFTNSPTPSFSFTNTPSFTSSNTPLPSSTFTPTYTITLTPVPVPYQVNVSVYNSAGEKVRSLYSGATQYQPGLFQLSANLLSPGSSSVSLLNTGALSGGRNVIIWDGINDQGQYVASGQYYFKIESKDPFGKVTDYIQKVDVVGGASQQSLLVFNAAGELVRQISLQQFPPLSSIGLGSSNSAFSVGNGGMGLPLVFRASNGSSNTYLWDGKDDQGQVLASGTYTLQLVSNAQAGNAVMSRQVQLVRAAPQNLAAVILAPNPASAGATRLNIYYPQAAGETGVALIYNLAGELVRQAADNTGNGTIQVDLNGLAGGIYKVNLELRQGNEMLDRKIMKFAVIR